MVDIIIPAYNSHDTIERTLGSILMQLNLDEIEVTIVNDGGDDYAEIVDRFQPIMKIKEIGYEINRGPGYARQYGVNMTDNEYIVFIDADDTFYESSSVQLLVNPLKETDTKFVISPFIQMGKEVGEQAKRNPNLVWVFGHAYRRSFLRKYGIEFTPTRANEDVGFNAMCNLIARHEMGVSGGKVLSAVTYQWQYNEVSITRRGKSEYEYGICTPGYIYNCHHAYDYAQKCGVELKEIAQGALETAFSCFIYYCVALEQEGLPKETLEAIEELSRDFFYDYYNQVQEYISKADFKQIYSQTLQGKAVHTQGIIFRMTLDQFVDLMFSKKPKHLPYEEYEKSVQQIAEQL